MPFALKGRDVTIFSVFRSLGLTVKIRPLLKGSEDLLKPEEDYENDEEDDLGDVVGDSLWPTDIDPGGGYEGADIHGVALSYSHRSISCN